MPKSVLTIIGAILLGLVVMAVFAIHAAHAAGIGAGDLRLSQHDLVVLLASISFAAVFAAFLYFLSVRGRKAQQGRWRQAWPPNVRRVEFFGDHFIVQQHLADFASAVGADFTYADKPSGEAIGPQSIVVWHVASSAALDASVGLKIASPVIVLAPRRLAPEITRAHPDWTLVTYPLLFGTFLKTLIAIARHGAHPVAPN